MYIQFPVLHARHIVTMESFSFDLIEPIAHKCSIKWCFENIIELTRKQPYRNATLGNMENRPICTDIERKN